MCVARILLTQAAMTDAGAVKLPTSEVVAAADSSSAMYNVLGAAPTGDTNHVLCRGCDEPLGDFGRRVEWRLRSLRNKSSVRKVCYLLGPHSPQDWLSCRQAFVTLIGLLGSGAEFELVTAPTLSIDVVQTLDELMPHAKVGVRVSIRRQSALAPEDHSTSDNRSLLGEHQPSDDCIEGDETQRPSGVHQLPGLASAGRHDPTPRTAALWG